jgi:hypothetical protein
MVIAGLLLAGLVAYVGGAVLAGVAVYSVSGEQRWSMALALAVFLTTLLPLALGWNSRAKHWPAAVTPASASGTTTLAVTPRVSAWLSRPWIGSGTCIALILAGILAFGFVVTTLLAFLLGALWAAYRRWRDLGQAPTVGEVFAAFLAVNALWLVAQASLMLAAGYVAPFRAALFIESMKELSIAVDPPADDKSIHVRVSFSMPHPLANYPEQE